MAELYGLDCTYQDCVHDTARGYRLYLKLRPDVRCHEHMQPPIPDSLPEQERLKRKVEWAKKRGTFCIAERNPIVFRESELDSAYAQIDLLGGKAESGAQVVEGHSSLPDGYSARMIVLLKIPLPRIALYFRWQPMTGEILNPDKVFQCVFMPESTMAERQTAAEVTLSEDQFNTVLRRLDTTRGMYTRDTLLKCQHCHRPLPVAAINTLTLRAVDKGNRGMTSVSIDVLKEEVADIYDSIHLDMVQHLSMAEESLEEGDLAKASGHLVHAAQYGVDFSHRTLAVYDKLEKLK